jgi:hypothetical protein
MVSLLLAFIFIPPKWFPLSIIVSACNSSLFIVIARKFRHGAPACAGKIACLPAVLLCFDAPFLLKKRGGNTNFRSGFA